MIHALVHGKLSRAQENMEDLLTSATFGRLAYAPSLLGQFLSFAYDSSGECPLAALNGAALKEMCFWPRMSEPGCTPCEPDLLIDLIADGGALYRVLIEAKFNSGKSSLADEGARGGFQGVVDSPRDQLAREWANLEQRGGGTRALVYLTADAAFPRKDVQEAQSELRTLHRAEGTLLWLSWRHLFRVKGNEAASTIRDDLVSMLSRLGLSDFVGVPLADCSLPSWRFASELHRFALEPSEPPRWRFDSACRQVSWPTSIGPIRWNFAKQRGACFRWAHRPPEIPNWRFVQ